MVTSWVSPPPLANEAGSRFEAASSGERSGLIGGEGGGKPAQMRPGARFQAAVRPFFEACKPESGSTPPGAAWLGPNCRSVPAIGFEAQQKACFQVPQAVSSNHFERHCGS